MATAMKLLLVVVAHAALCWSQAPGDEDDRCTVNHSNPPQYPDNVRNLMDSYNYENLLPGNGTGNSPIATAVWNDFSFDGNDVTPETLSPTYWQQGAGGICRFQTRVCGWRQNGVIVSQNNWLFTQNISSDFDSNIYNYDVTIHVEAIYSLQSCRLRQGCIQRFNLLHYMTQQLPSTSGNGYMKTKNYEIFAVPEGPVSSVTYTNTYSFPLPPSYTGFYIAVQDIGSCIALSRLRIYRENCKSFQTGLVWYPNAPAPVSGEASVNFTCVPNGGVMGDEDTVNCGSDGTWAEGSPMCGCRPGYEINQAKDGCQICPEGQYQPLLSDANECKPCPPQSSTRDEGTAVCPCDANFIRHSDRPDDRCIRPPTAPQLDLTKPPQLEGNKITAIWTPPTDSGGDSDNLYFDVYSAQLKEGQNPTFCRQNEERINKGCNAEGSECSYEITSLKPNSPYAILVVSGNSATNDPECVSNVTVLGSRYLVMVVGTEDAIDESGLSVGAAVGITFIVAVVVTAAATATIVILIVFFCFRRRGSYSSTATHSRNTDTPTTTKTTVDMYSLDEKPPQLGNSSMDSKPSPAKKPGRPLAPPPKPPIPSRPTPPSRPNASPTYNGY